MKTINCNNGWYLGLGDLLCYGWLDAGARAAGESVAWFATGWRAEVLRLLGIAPVDDPEGSILTEGGFEEAMQRGEKTTYLAAIASELGISSTPIRPTLDIPHGDRAWAEQNRKRVLLFPQTHGASKQWPAAYWIELAWSLHRQGIETCVVLLKAEERYTQNVPFWMTSISHSQLFALTALADLVISNDSGPAHLGGLLNIPTVAILGVTSGAVFAHLRSVYILRQNQLGCSGCHYGKPYRPACRIGCQELFRTHPETVLDFATGILAGPVELPVETPSTTPIPRRKKK